MLSGDLQEALAALDELKTWSGVVMRLAALPHLLSIIDGRANESDIVTFARVRRSGSCLA